MQNKTSCLTGHKHLNINQQLYYISIWPLTESWSDASERVISVTALHSLTNAGFKVIVQSVTIVTGADGPIG